MTDTIDRLALLREPFRPEEIRYLPRVWCRACRDSRAGCNQHQVIKCPKCRQGRISSAHIDLAFVGHAEATNRLLNVDPTWTWEPVAFTPQGLPQFDDQGGLWIRLTVCGITRLGYGHAEGKRGGDAIKEIIGDAIRNAGMRFGMALDLWTSSDLEIADNGPSDQKTQDEQRDFVAEAEQCMTADCAADIYRAAQAAGADEAVLNKIKAIGIQLRAVEQNNIEHILAEEAGDDGKHSADPAGIEHAKAVAALKAWAAENGITNTDIEAQAYTALGAPLDDVGADAIWNLLKQLTT